MDNGRIIIPKGNRKINQTEKVKRIAKELALDIVYYGANLDRNRKVGNNRAATSTAAWFGDQEVPSQTLRRTVDEITTKHKIVYASIVERIHLTSHNMEEVFVSIATEIFKDEQYNWGRIVSLYAFASSIAKYAIEHELCENNQNNIAFIGEFVGNFVVDKLGWWIEANGGWSAFEEYFPEREHVRMEQTIWRGLLITGGVGLAALAAVVAVR